MADPVLELLELVQKLNYLVEQSPSLQLDTKYTYIEQFRRWLFG